MYGYPVAIWEYLFLEAITGSSARSVVWRIDGEEVPDMDGWHPSRAVNHFGGQGWELMHVRDGPFLPAALVMRRVPGATE
jgi:hypothetical protein